MHWVEILNRIANGEDERTELTRCAGDLTAPGKAICAFANGDGGLLILGVDDAQSIVGAKEDPEKLQERLMAFLQSGLSSPVSARMGRQLDSAGWVHWLEVPRQRGLEPLRFGGRVWVRRGRSSVEPSPAELQDLYNSFGYIVTEERYVEAAGLGDIDVEAFRRYLSALGLDLFSEPQPRLEQDLRTRGVVTALGRSMHPTLYGVLAFGRASQSFPQTQAFWVECVAYEGRDRSGEVLLVGEAKGRLDEQVDRTIGWVRGLGRFEHYEGVGRSDVPLVPERVLREAVVNAVAHRDYAVMGSRVLVEVFQDRLEVTSPGTLPNGITPESVVAGGHPRSRNQLIANLLQALGKMEQRGRGWPIMKRLMAEHNGTEPELREDRGGRYVRVILRLV